MSFEHFFINDADIEKQNNTNPYCKFVNSIADLLLALVNTCVLLEMRKNIITLTEAEELRLKKNIEIIESVTGTTWDNVKTF